MKTNEHDDRESVLVFDLAVVLAQKGDKLIVADLDELLRWVDLEKDFLAKGFFPDILSEGFDDFEINIGF